LQIWQKYATDSIITSYILDLFEEFSKNTYYYAALCTTALPFISQVFSTTNTDAIVHAVSAHLYVKDQAFL
jgi:hypothetical protein